VNDLKRVSFDTEWTWEIGGESVIFSETIPNPPRSGDETLIRITHSNVYWPIDDVELFVRVGDPEHPTDFEDLDSAADWVKAELVEEIVLVDDEEMHRAQAEEPFGREEEVPWDGTYEARLSLPAGRTSIEIKVSGNGIVQSGVISDWALDVR
jgi:hypothetical protein